MDGKVLNTIMHITTLGYVVNENTIIVPPSKGAVVVLDEVKFLMRLGYRLNDKLDILGLANKKKGGKRGNKR